MPATCLGRVGNKACLGPVKYGLRKVSRDEYAEVGGKCLCLDVFLLTFRIVVRLPYWRYSPVYVALALYLLSRPLSDPLHQAV